MTLDERMRQAAALAAEMNELLAELIDEAREIAALLAPDTEAARIAA